MKSDTKPPTASEAAEAYRDSVRGNCWSHDDDASKPPAVSVTDIAAHFRAGAAWAYDSEAVKGLESALEMQTFALQCMIIGWNGAVPGLTAQETFDGALLARDRAKDALANFKRLKTGGK